MGQSSSSSKLPCLNENSQRSSSDAHRFVQSFEAPITSSYNERIRPLLDVVDKLRRLEVMKEGIQLPTIVVVGDQSSGKSSVLESLAGISLPKGQGICTRVPLILRLQHHSSPRSEFHLEYSNISIPIDESDIASSIQSATDEIAGIGKGISNTPITLVVKKSGVADLTMVDLPGITRVPIHGQPDDIYEQISAIIMEYINPEESIILNVLSATVDFPTCESIRMSQKVDKTGERTLAVVTKADRAPEGLLEKVSTDAVNIGLGYVCVRNRIGGESFEEALTKEKRLFEFHQLLSKIDKSMVSIPVLAQRLVHIQAAIITRRLPEIVKKINDKLKHKILELKRMPQNLASMAEAMTALMQIVGLAKESLRKILLRGEFDEYPEDKQMHCTARFAEMLNQYADNLRLVSAGGNPTEDFLVEEIIVLEETKGIGLPNFLPRTAFLVMLQRKVKVISHIPIQYVGEVWDYIEGVVVAVLLNYSQNYPQLQSATRQAVHNLFAKTKEHSVARAVEIIEMEKMTDYTCDSEYMSQWNKLMALESSFIEKVSDLDPDSSTILLEGFGEIDVGHLRKYHHVLPQAFDMKMRMTSYWKIVQKRLVDSMALHLLYSVQNLVNRDMELEIVNELFGGSNGSVGEILRMLEESPSVAAKREKLDKSIRTLKESKEVLAKIMDTIGYRDR